MKLIDANVILRYLLKEPLDQAEKAKAVIESGAFTTMEVMSEVVYVLQKVYAISRDEISVAVTEIASDIAIDEYEVLILAMDFFRARKLDFVDCVLAARSVVKKDDVFSFDKKLMSLINTLRKSP